MPGISTSVPNTGLPAILSGTSRRLTGLPSSCHSSGSLRNTVSGGGSEAASAATAPNPRVRPEGVWVMRLFSARHSPAGTPQRRAAAPTSSSRATAPAVRRYSWEPRMERLPPVLIDWNTLLRRRLVFAVTYSARTRFQSQPSSSATSMGRAVKTPCPISERATRTTTLSSGWIMIQALTSTG
jgi:hypothetical protein